MRSSLSIYAWVGLLSLWIGLLMACASSAPPATTDPAPTTKPAADPTAGHSPAAPAAPTSGPGPTDTQEKPETARNPLGGILPLGPCHVGNLTDEEEKELDRLNDWLDEDARRAPWVLHAAAAENGRKVVLTVLNDGADANAQDEHGRTPLHMAVYNSEHPELPEVITALAECGGADPNLGPGGWVPLNDLEYGNSQDSAVAQALIDAGADPNIKTAHGWTPLHQFAQRLDVKDPAVAQVLVDAGADMNAKTGEKGETPLHMARNLDVVKILLDAGAEANVSDNNGITPLHHAGSTGRVTEIQTLLLEAGADPNAKNEYGATPLFGVWDDPARIQALLDAGADVSVTDNEGKTPLFERMRPDTLEVFKALLAAGVDPNAQNSYGITVLHVIQGSVKEAAIQLTETHTRLLLDAGADPNIQDQNGRTPLHYASAPGPAQMLLDAGADPTIRDNKEWTPLDMYLDRTESSRRRNPQQIHYDTIKVLTPPKE